MNSSRPDRSTSTNTLLRSGAILAIVATGFYPLLYFAIDRTFGLLGSKSDSLLADPFWNAAFYTHILAGGVAMLSGWSQFLRGFRNRNPSFHRRLGYLYTGAVVFSGIAGVILSFSATGGWIAATGFFGLGVTWLSSTSAALFFALKRDFSRHKKAMVVSYATTLAALTLRIELPLLIVATGDFFIAYPIVAWLCWVPNLAVASWINRFRPQYF